MTDSFLLNSGDFLVLNDGTSTLLMNEHVDEIKIHGVHSTQRTVQRRKAQLIPVSFTFKLKANTIRKIHVHLTNFAEQLRPHGVYTDAIRNSFKIPLTDLRLKLNQLGKQLKKEAKEQLNVSIIELRESIVKDEDFVLDFVLLKWLNRKIKRMKK